MPAVRIRLFQRLRAKAAHVILDPSNHPDHRRCDRRPGRGSAAKNVNLGPVGNIITGAIGGGVGGQILAQVVPTLAASDVDMGSIVGQLVGGGAAGAVLTAIVGAVKDAMAKR
jgi:hypothetical protein